MLLLSFFISFDRLVVILLILCVIPFWDSAQAHSPTGFLQLNPGIRILGRGTSAYKFHFILRHPSLELSSFTLRYKALSFHLG